MDDLHFDQSALSSLTNKINVRLSAENESAPRKESRNASHRRRGTENGTASNPKRLEPNAKGGMDTKSKPGSSVASHAERERTHQALQERNTKRLRNGQLKTTESAAKVHSIKKNRSHDKHAAEDSASHSRAGGGDDGIHHERPYQGSNKDARFQNLPRKDKSNPEGDYSGLLLEAFPEWYTNELPDISGDQSDVKLPVQAVTALHERGKNLLQKENEHFASRNRSTSSSHQFYTTIITSGTLTDKVSALTLLVQESPLHNMRALETLIGLASKRSRAQAIEVLTALKDLFAQGSLLPPSRHLKVFNSQAGLSCPNIEAVKNYNSSRPAPFPLRDAHLITWTYEDWLKGKYFDVLRILETWCNDEIPHSRSKAVDMLYELLREKPEQEANLLRLLVNKLGDSEKRIASRASYNLLQLQNPHPMMKTNIISAIESDIIFRPGQSLHAKYYAITTLNQTVLSNKDESATRKLLDIYFSLFASLLAQQTSMPMDDESTKNRKGEMQGGGGRPGKMAKKKNAASAQKGASVEDAMREKITSAILTGINRAIPYTDTSNEFFERHLDTLFRITHSSNFNTSIQAMLLIQQLCGAHPAAFDRFYRTLYESLLDPRLLQSSKQVLYLNLLYRALKSDLNVKRVQAFAKRLLQVVAMHQPAFVCAVVYLLRELEDVFPSLSTFIDQPEEDLAEDERPNDHALGPNMAPKIAPYDGKKRDPGYSNADHSCLWELDPLLQHFHPSVTLFATSLLGHEPMPSKPTLESHTLIQFLDRFVYRNPKKNANKWHGPSIMQPLAAADSREQLLAPGREGLGKPLVNSAAFASLPIDKVHADEVFFHNYFSKLGTTKGKSKRDKKRREAEGESEGEGEDEDEIWQALLDSRPDIEGGDDDVDLDADDFSDDADLGAAMDDLSGSDLEWEDEASDLGDLEEPTLLPTDGKEVEEKGETSTSSRRKASSTRRKELRDLPTFASADDYAAMVENVEGEVSEL